VFEYPACAPTKVFPGPECVLYPAWYPINVSSDSIALEKPACEPTHVFSVPVVLL